MKKLVILQPDSKLLDDDNIERIHTYATREVLARISATIEDEAALSPVNTGVKLGKVAKQALMQARNIPVTRLIELQEELLAYVELIGPTDPEWLNIIGAADIETLCYQPENTYLCKGLWRNFNQLRSHQFIIDVIPLTSELKSRVQIPAQNKVKVWILLTGTDEDVKTVINELNITPEIDINPEQHLQRIDFYKRVYATLTSEGQEVVLAHSAVLAVELQEEANSEGEIAALIVAGLYNSEGIPDGSYLRWLEDQGINGEGVAIGVIDGGIDPANPAFKGRVKVICQQRTLSDHATMVASGAVGKYLVEYQLRERGIEDKNFYSIGIAPGAELLSQGDCDSNSIENLCRETVLNTGPCQSAGLIQNNSWGKGLCDPMNYTSDEAAYDRMVRNADPLGKSPKPLTICFSAGNKGKQGLTRPKAAKNIIVTGNSENYRPELGALEADNINHVYSESSHGNCGDGRIRPQITAPGEWTAAIKPIVRAKLRSYQFSGGTSASNPRTAGACALLIQWWRQHNNGSDPSPAMLRALIVNGAVDMNFAGHIPNNRQGWGRLNLFNILNADLERIYVDQTIMINKRESGADRVSWQIIVADHSQPVKITLAWTDPPGSFDCGTKDISAIVNELALRVEIDGKLYLANNFINGWSVPSQYGAIKEGADNLQNIYLQAGEVTGIIKVTVIGLAIRSNCLTCRPDNPQQDFALVITNARSAETIPATICLAIDSALMEIPEPTCLDNFWHESVHTGDADELNLGWWQELDLLSELPPKIYKFEEIELVSKPARPSELKTCQLTTHRQLDDLIVEMGESIKLPNTDREHQFAFLIPDQPVDKLGSHLHRLTFLTKIADADQFFKALIQEELSVTLTQLVTNWQELIATGNTLRLTVIIIVGNCTRVLPQDIMSLRYLSFIGKLNIISYDREILTFLAQRINRKAGIHFHLAGNSLADLLGNVITEICVGKKKIDQQTDDLLKSKSGFITLEPRTVWRQRLAQQLSFKFVTGKIAEYKTSSGGIKGYVRICNGKHELELQVSSPVINKRLSFLDLTDNFYFGIGGNELLAVVPCDYYC